MPPKILIIRKNWRSDSNVANPQISAIITRNTKDFKDSSLEVIDSVDFL